MKILTLNTSTYYIEICLSEGDKIISDIVLHTPNKYLSKLIPVIDDFLKINDKDISNIDLIAVNTGPGSYTGIRIGLATAKGLSIGTDKPIIGVNSFDVVANHYKYLSSKICVLKQTKNNTYYYSYYEKDNDILMHCKILPQDGTIDDIILKLDSGSILITLDEIKNDVDYKTLWNNITIISAIDINISRLISQYIYDISINSSEYSELLDNEVNLEPLYLQKLSFKPKKEKVLNI